MSFDSAPTSTTAPASTTAPTSTKARLAFPAILGPICLLLACLLGFAGAAPAQAHDQLVQSSPAPEAALDASPTDIALSYSANIMEIGPMIVLQDAAGRDWLTGEPVIDGTTVTSTIDETLPDGTYAINWRVVSSDGHPITGTIPFTVGDATTDAPAAEAGAEAKPEPAPASSESPSGATTEPTAEITSKSALDVPRMLLIGGLGAVVALGVAWVIVRSRRGGNDAR